MLSDRLVHRFVAIATKIIFMPFKLISPHKVCYVHVLFFACVPVFPIIYSENVEIHIIFFFQNYAIKSLLLLATFSTAQVCL